MKPFGKILNKRGITLVELIISLVISLLVLAAGSFILLSQSGVFRAQNSISSETQRLNVAFNATRYSLRMAGFDYGSGFYSNQNLNVWGITPIEINNPNAGTPYEVLVSYSEPNTSCSILSRNGANLYLSPNCNNFLQGEIFVVTNATYKSGQSGQSTVPLCVSQVFSGRIVVNHGNDNCGHLNTIPPHLPTGGNITVMRQVLFFWSPGVGSPPNPPTNQCVGNPPVYQFNNGNTYCGGYLYMCEVAGYVPQGTQPTCSTAPVTLDSYVTDFLVTPSSLLNSYSQPYQYALTLSGESDVVISSSPNYSVNSAYNSSGANSSGYNIVKTLSSTVLSRNIQYGK